MKITVLFTGKTTKKYLEEGIAEYGKRIRRYVSFETRVVNQLKNQRDILLVKKQEGKLILRTFDKETFVILLDERGTTVTSGDFAEIIRRKMIEGKRKLAFVIGGAYGVSDEVFRRADQIIRLSSMTFSHQVVRILLMEQLYRAFTIIRGEPYHHA